MNHLKLATILAAAALALSPTQAAAQETSKPVSLGIQFSGTADGSGAEVVKMLPDRTGAAIGFKVGDILIEAGGKPISQEVLMAYMKQVKVGDQLSFKVKRAGQVIELTGKGMAAPEGSAPLPPPEPQPQQQPQSEVPTCAEPEGASDEALGDRGPLGAWPDCRVLRYACSDS